MKEKTTKDSQAPSTAGKKKRRSLDERIDVALVTMRNLASDLFAERGPGGLSLAIQECYSSMNDAVKSYRQPNLPGVAK